MFALGKLSCAHVLRNVPNKCILARLIEHAHLAPRSQSVRPEIENKVKLRRLLVY